MLKKRKRGRPRKKEDAIAFWQFGRAARAMCAYDEARERGDKHSVAVRYAVDVLKRRNPKMPISEAEIRRVLAAWRPRGSHTILRFERSTLSEQDAEKLQWIRGQLAALEGKKDLTSPVLSIDNPPKTATIVKIRLAERPQYARHNRRISKE